MRFGPSPFQAPSPSHSPLREAGEDVDPEILNFLFAVSYEDMPRGSRRDHATSAGATPLPRANSTDDATAVEPSPAVEHSSWQPSPDHLPKQISVDESGKPAALDGILRFNPLSHAQPSHIPDTYDTISRGPPRGRKRRRASVEVPSQPEGTHLFVRTRKRRRRMAGSCRPRIHECTEQSDAPDWFGPGSSQRNPDQDTPSAPGKVGLLNTRLDLEAARMNSSGGRGDDRDDDDKAYRDSGYYGWVNQIHCELCSRCQECLRCPIEGRCGNMCPVCKRCGACAYCAAGQGYPPWGCFGEADGPNESEEIQISGPPDFQGSNSAYPKLNPATTTTQILKTPESDSTSATHTPSITPPKPKPKPKDPVSGIPDPALDDGEEDIGIDDMEFYMESESSTGDSDESDTYRYGEDTFEKECLEYDVPRRPEREIQGDIGQVFWQDWNDPPEIPEPPMAESDRIQIRQNLLRLRKALADSQQRKTRERALERRRLRKTVLNIEQEMEQLTEMRNNTEADADGVDARARSQRKICNELRRLRPRMDELSNLIEIRQKIAIELCEAARKENWARKMFLDGHASLDTLPEFEDDAHEVFIAARRERKAAKREYKKHLAQQDKLKKLRDVADRHRAVDRARVHADNLREQFERANQRRRGREFTPPRSPTPPPPTEPGWRMPAEGLPTTVKIPHNPEEDNFPPGTGGPMGWPIPVGHWPGPLEPYPPPPDVMEQPPDYTIPSGPDPETSFVRSQDRAENNVRLAEISARRAAVSLFSLRAEVDGIHAELARVGEARDAAKTAIIFVAANTAAHMLESSYEIICGMQDRINTHVALIERDCNTIVSLSDGVQAEANAHIGFLPLHNLFVRARTAAATVQTATDAARVMQAQYERALARARELVLEGIHFATSRRVALARKNFTTLENNARNTRAAVRTARVAAQVAVDARDAHNAAYTKTIQDLTAAVAARDATAATVIQSKGNLKTARRNVRRAKRSLATAKATGQADTTAQTAALTSARANIRTLRTSLSADETLAANAENAFQIVNRNGDNIRRVHRRLLADVWRRRAALVSATEASRAAQAAFDSVRSEDPLNASETANAAATAAAIAVAEAVAEKRRAEERAARTAKIAADTNDFDNSAAVARKRKAEKEQAAQRQALADTATAARRQAALNAAMQLATDAAAAVAAAQKMQSDAAASVAAAVAGIGKANAGGNVHITPRRRQRRNETQAATGDGGGGGGGGGNGGGGASGN